MQLYKLCKFTDDTCEMKWWTAECFMQAKNALFWKSEKNGTLPNLDEGAEGINRTRDSAGRVKHWWYKTLRFIILHTRKCRFSTVVQLLCSLCVTSGWRLNCGTSNLSILHLPHISSHFLRFQQNALATHRTCISLRYKGKGKVYPRTGH